MRVSKQNFFVTSKLSHIMAVIQKTDRVFVPFKLIQVGSQTVLVPDLHIQSYIVNGSHNKYRSIDWHSNHLSQIYISNSHTPQALVNDAINDDYDSFEEHAKKLGHKDIPSFYAAVSERLRILKMPKQVDFDKEEDFFEDIF